MILVICVTILGNVKAATYGLNLASHIEGKIVTVKLSVSNPGDGIDAIQGKLSYDSSKLELQEVKQANTNWKEPDYAASTGMFTALIKAESVKQVSDILVFTFQVKENITGKIEIKFSNLALATSNDEKIEIQDATTSVTIEGEKQEDPKNEIDQNTTTNNTVENTVVENNVVNTTNTTNQVNIQNQTNTTGNTIKANQTQSTQATTKLPKTGINAGIFYLIGVISIVAGISIIRYKDLSK